MDIDFINGGTGEKNVTRQVIPKLLNLPPETMPLVTWEISFVEDPDEGRTHNEFAITTTPDIGAGFAETRIRKDAPDFKRSGPDWSGINFYQETVAHELGHAMFWNLPENRRLAVCRMFGVNSDDPDVINNHDQLWEDRIGEGIAETFKDAFLPPQFRRYYNRTHHKIPIAKYPAFRSHFRFDEGYDGFSYVYGSSAFRVDLTDKGLGGALPYHRSDRDHEAFVFYQELEGFEHGWGVDMSQFEESDEMPFSIEVGEGGGS